MTCGVAVGVGSGVAVAVGIGVCVGKDVPVGSAVGLGVSLGATVFVGVGVRGTSVGDAGGFGLQPATRKMIINTGNNFFMQTFQ